MNALKYANVDDLTRFAIQECAKCLLYDLINVDQCFLELNYTFAIISEKMHFLPKNSSVWRFLKISAFKFCTLKLTFRQEELLYGLYLNFVCDWFFAKDSREFFDFFNKICLCIFENSSCVQRLSALLRGKCFASKSDMILQYAVHLVHSENFDFLIKFYTGLMSICSYDLKALVIGVSEKLLSSKNSSIYSIAHLKSDSQCKFLKLFLNFLLNFISKHNCVIPELCRLLIMYFGGRGFCDFTEEVATQTTCFNLLVQFCNLTAKILKDSSNDADIDAFLAKWCFCLPRKLSLDDESAYRNLLSFAELYFMFAESHHPMTIAAFNGFFPLSFSAVSDFRILSYSLQFQVIRSRCSQRIDGFFEVNQFIVEICQFFANRTSKQLSTDSTIQSVLSLRKSLPDAIVFSQINGLLFEALSIVHLLFQKGFENSFCFEEVHFTAGWTKCLVSHSTFDMQVKLKALEISHIVLSYITRSFISSDCDENAHNTQYFEGIRSVCTSVPVKKLFFECFRQKMLELSRNTKCSTESTHESGSKLNLCTLKITIECFVMSIIVYEENKQQGLLCALRYNLTVYGPSSELIRDGASFDRRSIAYLFIIYIFKHYSLANLNFQCELVLCNLFLSIERDENLYLELCAISDRHLSIESILNCSLPSASSTFLLESLLRYLLELLNINDEKLNEVIKTLIIIAKKNSFQLNYNQQMTGSAQYLALIYYIFSFFVKGYSSRLLIEHKGKCALVCIIDEFFMHSVSRSETICTLNNLRLICQSLAEKHTADVLCAIFRLPQKSFVQLKDSYENLFASYFDSFSMRVNSDLPDSLITSKYSEVEQCRISAYMREFLRKAIQEHLVFRLEVVFCRLKLFWINSQGKFFDPKNEWDAFFFEFFFQSEIINNFHTHSLPIIFKLACMFAIECTNMITRSQYFMLVQSAVIIFGLLDAPKDFISKIEISACTERLLSFDSFNFLKELNCLDEFVETIFVFWKICAKKHFEGECNIAHIIIQQMYFLNKVYCNEKLFQCFHGIFSYHTVGKERILEQLGYL